ncbi:MAG: hypothetical protein DI536_22575 [Archangium gephyra]|uniref:Uncharacterized protein n=1 Tax=Archangium gephyra TaxID=48 RepID=A0A2W5T0W1_9BACT|nr:MAG: hypothetical protein DI536_22575 [Archangium gephyra]
MLLLTVIASMASAQVPAFFDPPATEARRQLYTVRVKKPPTIDGALDDDAWLDSVPSGDFVQYEPRQGEKATHRSTVRVVFDDDALYVAAELEQPGGWTAFNQRDMRRDFPNHESDSFTVIFDTLGDGRNAFSFSVNPWGAQRDEQVVDDTLFEPNWDTVWRVATKRDENGWTVEYAIPWKSLRHGGPGVRWGVQFARRERGRNEDTVWSPIPRTVTPWRMAYSGLTVGLEAAKPSLLSLQLRPYLIGRMDVTGDGAPVFGGSGGGEVTWNPTDNTVLDLTGNTDFAETDVDRRVVNLSRFSVFFPERRQFFLESAGVFAAGAQGLLMPFFSRRIGLDDDGRAVTITAGGRFVYRSTERSIGGLVVHTLPTASANSSLFGVARYSQNLGEQSRLGGMVVARHDFDGVGGEGNTNVVPTIDGLYRVGAFTLQATLMGSTTSTRSVGTTFGGAGTLEAKVQGNWGSIAVNALGVSPGFEARSGFVGRTDILGVGAEAELDYRPQWLPSFIRSIGPFVDSLVLWAASTQQFQEATTYFSPLWVLFSGGDEAWLFAESSQQVLTETFEPVNNVSFAPGSYSYERFGAAFLTQASRKASLQGEVAGGEYYTASTVHAMARASVQPLPYVSVAGQYTYNHFWGPGVVGAFAQTHLLLVEGRLALSPKLQLIGSYQRDTDGNASILNARLAWEFLPLSFVYVVLTDTRNAYVAPNTPPSEFRVVAKVTYTWRP